MFAKRMQTASICNQFTCPSFHIESHAVISLATSVFRKIEVIIIKKMITCLITSIVFASGYIAAAIDWRQFLQTSFTLTGIRKANQLRFVLCIFAILVSFIVPLMVCIRVYENSQSNLYVSLSIRYD